MLKHALMPLVLVAATGLPWAAPAPDCSSGHAKIEAVAETRAALASVNASIDRQQAQLDAGIRDVTARTQWSERDRARFLQTVLGSKPNAEFEKRIGALTGELRALLGASQRGEVKGPVAECRHAPRVRELAGQLESVLERQSAYLDRQLRNVRQAGKPG